MNQFLEISCLVCISYMVFINSIIIELVVLINCSEVAMFLYFSRSTVKGSRPQNSIGADRSDDSDSDLIVDDVPKSRGKHKGENIINHCSLYIAIWK